MCQIIYSPDGHLCSHADFWEANRDNNDGIGVMSPMGVQKFFGKRQVKRAWAYVQVLAAEQLAWAAHFRFATAGKRDRNNVHPFTASNGVQWMHNGVMRDASLYDSLGERSDTALFVDLLGGIDDPDKCVDLLEMTVGLNNKLLAYAPRLDSWTIINEHLGEWDGGIWFSNEYSRANWASKYGRTGNTSPTVGAVSGYLYDPGSCELTELRADGSKGDTRSATQDDMDKARRGYSGGIDASGKQIVVLAREDQVLPSRPHTAGQVRSLEAMAKNAAAVVKSEERMALMANTRSDAAERETCKTCSRMELKRCYCANGPNTGVDIDIALDVLDQRQIDDDAGHRVSLMDPALIQERVDAYLREEEDERSRYAAGAD
jgi:hypothetical protein